MSLRVIDIETTGIDAERDEIVEIGSIDLTQDGGFKAPHDVLVKPSIAIPPAASAVHGIIDADVEEASNLTDVLPSFSGASIYVAHNADFEKKFLVPHWPTSRWLCTFKCALRVWPDAPGHSNQILRYWHGIIHPFGKKRETIDPHRALSDCFVTGEIAQRLLRAAPFGQLMQWSSEPALLRSVHFGKHRGDRFEDVPTDYLEWLIRMDDMSEDVKFSAQYWLNQRSAN